MKKLALSFYTALLVLLCSCASNLSVTKEISQDLPTSPQVVQENDVVISKTPEIGTTKERELICKPVIQAKWGKGITDFGYYFSSESQRVIGPYQPVFDEQGIMYVADPANNRVLRFVNMHLPDVIPIPDSYIFDYNERSKIWWSNISISGEHIIFKYSAWKDRIVERLAVLNVKGEEEKTIELDLLFPLRSNFSSPILPDRDGGFYYLLEPLGMIYFSADFHSDLLGLGSDWPYTDTVVGWDRNLYSYSVSEDRLFSWGESGNVRLTQLQPAQTMSDVGSEIGIDKGWGKLIGVDKDGLINMLFTDDKENRWLLRFSMIGEQIEKSLVSEEMPNHLILAPDNSYYMLSYNDNSTVEPPIIIRCTLK